MNEAPPPLPYQCPGENQSISKSVHLGRLASFYQACHGCPHRTETGTLAPSQKQQLLKVHLRQRRQTLFTQEAVAGTIMNDLQPAQMRHFAIAAGILFRRNRRAQTDFPTVALASDGRPLASESLAAVSEGLRYAGCKVVDVGYVTAPVVTFAIGDLNAAGGVYVGNPLGERQTIGLSFWSENSRPLSAGGQLDELRQIATQPLSRPLRRSGRLRRVGAQSQYLASLSSYFHALRPLRFVIDSTSEALMRYAGQLTSAVACDVISGACHSDADAATLAMAQQVKDTESQFGIWIDGEGRQSQLVDHRGRRIDSEGLLWLLARYLLDQRPEAAVTVPTEASPGLVKSLQDNDIAVFRGGATGEETYHQMIQCNAALGLDAHGQLWLGDDHPAVDGLKTLALVLCALSQGDRDLADLALLSQAVH